MQPLGQGEYYFSPLTGYHLLDTFSTDLAAGSVNGTLADTGGARTVVDTNNKISITGGKLSFATGAAVSDGIWYPVQTRAAGKIINGTITPADETTLVRFGFDNNTTGTVYDSLNISNTILQTTISGAAALNIGLVAATTTYKFMVVMRGTGMFFLIKGGAFTYWTLALGMQLGNANAYPAIVVGATSVFTADDIKIPPSLWLPAPLASDGFSGATLTDGLGHPETTGVGSGGSGLTWTGATWGVAGGVVNNTPTVEADEQLTNGNMETGDPPTGWSGQTLDGVADERTGGAGAQSLDVILTGTWGSTVKAITSVVGQWYQATAWVKIIPSAGVYFSLNNASSGIPYTTSTTWVQLTATGRANTTGVTTAFNSPNTNDNYRVDDVSVKKLTLMSLFRSVQVANANVKVRVSGISCYRGVKGTQFGCAARLATDKTSGIVLYWDGASNIKLDEFTGSTTWSNLLTVVKGFATSDSIELDLSGSAFRCYHITAAGVTTLLGSGTCTVDGSLGTDAGIFSTDLTNTGDNFVVYAKGDNNEYGILDRIT